MLTRKVDGREVALTSAEEAKIRAEWQANAAKATQRRRAVASLTRDEFLARCAAARYITEAVAEEAASAQWPAAFDAFIAGLSFRQRLAAKAAWADGGVVHRDNPILALIAADLGVNDAQLDAMFGVE